MTFALDADALNAFLQDDFWQVKDTLKIEEVTDEGVIVRLKPTEENLRPGGTVSGPTMFMLADCAVYFAILSRIGMKPLTVTTNASIDYMRKPAANADLLCHVRLLKIGRVLAVGDCLIYSDGVTDPVATARMTYSIPPA